MPWCIKGEPKVPGSGKKAKGVEPRVLLVSGRVSRSVREMLDSLKRSSAEQTDGALIELAVRELFEKREKS